MKLSGSIEVQVPGERVLRDPNLWDKLRKAFGGVPDLRTDRVRAALESAALVDVARGALRRVGVTNAISLVIDDQVVFEDREGRPDDLGDLFLAFHDSAAACGAGFSLLRLAAEHEEAGLHLVIEIIARAEHALGEAAARVVVAGRIRDFEPRGGEDAEAYRRRVEPLTREAGLLTAHRHQFESFMARLEGALRLVMPEARLELRAAEAQVQRPSRRERKVAPPPPTDRRYDPYERYYPNPFGGMLSAVIWGSLLSSTMRPDVVVVNEHGDAVGNAADMSSASDEGGDFGGDPGGELGGDAGGDPGGDPGGELGGDGGGDFGGGDFGGGDFGGGDFGGDF